MRTWGASAAPRREGDGSPPHPFLFARSRLVGEGGSPPPPGPPRVPVLRPSRPDPPVCPPPSSWVVPRHKSTRLPTTSSAGLVLPALPATGGGVGVGFGPRRLRRASRRTSNGHVWFYRDWVINALNADLPYDQFVIEQIAGDLLPNATQDQIVATGFLRNSMINEEGGVDPEQFRMEAMFDRMDAIGKSVLGLTIQCAQCHNHKYDPLSRKSTTGCSPS